MISIKRKTIGDIAMDVVVYTILTVISIMMVLPFVYVIVTSFIGESDIIAGTLFKNPGNIRFTLDAYKEIFDMNGMGGQVFRSLGVSVGVTLVGTIINLFLTTTMAYGLSRSDLDGKKIILNMVLFTMVVSGGMIPLFILVNTLGLYDTYAALILPGAISAYNMLIIRNFFMELPGELQEAASIDGCSDIGIFVKIALPLSLPCLATFGLFYAVGHWNNYFPALIYLDNAEKYPFQLVLRTLIIDQQADMIIEADKPKETLKMAVIVVGTIPILLVYPFLQKHFAAGVMVGAIKG